MDHVADLQMSGHPPAIDWAATRGEKWRVHATGMEAMLAAVDEPLIRALRLDAPCSIADVGCGGAATTLEIFRRAPAGSAVRGFDISPVLVDLARDRARRQGVDVTFDVANVATATAGPFDRLVSRFGIMFFDDPPTAFANLARWLVPGGRFAFAVWGREVDNPWSTTVRDVVAGVVAVPSPEPGAPGPYRYAEADALLALLHGAGLAAFEVHDWRGAFPIGGGMPAREAAAFALASFSSFNELLAEAGDVALEEARRALAARFDEYERDGAVLMDASVHIVTGARR